MNAQGPFERLDAAECRRLLGTARMGRLGFTDRAMPAILPVPFALCDDSALIPAALGGSLMKAVRGAVVALEVDSYREELETGWSVTAVGPTRVISNPVTVAELDALDLFPRAAGPPGGYISVHLGLLRGWRTGLADVLHRRVPPPGEEPVAVV
jgi:hypothetical protein